MKNIKVIYWDLGGVLMNGSVRNFLDSVNNKLREKIKFNISPISIDKRLDIGEISMIDFIQEKMSRHLTNEEERFIEYHWSHLFKLNTELFYFIFARSKQFRMGILSNADNINAKRHRELFIDNSKTFDKDLVILSSEYNMMKPKKEIFDLAITKADCKPEEILFIDDSNDNLAAAKGLGMNTYLYKYNLVSNKKVFEYINSLIK